MTMRKSRKILLGAIIVAAVVFAAGLFIPYSFQNPVEGATRNDYNQESYWYYPWGTSVTHKGVDVFKKNGTPIHPAAAVELVLFAGRRGSNAVNTPPHLHFSIMSLLPHPWDIDDSPHGKMKALYMNPVPYLNEYHSRNSRMD